MRHRSDVGSLSRPASLPPVSAPLQRGIRFFRHFFALEQPALAGLAKRVKPAHFFALEQPALAGLAKRVIGKRSQWRLNPPRESQSTLRCAHSSAPKR